MRWKSKKIKKMLCSRIYLLLPYVANLSFAVPHINASTCWEPNT